jgi:hypothetical protein
MDEQWKWITGYAGLAAVSDLGRVFCDNGGGLLTPYMDGGIQYVRLWDRGPKLNIARTVLTEFRGARGPNSRVKHINDIADDNKLTNLVWGTMTDLALLMVRKRTRTTGKILPETARKEIREKLLQKRGTYEELAKWYGVSSRTIRRIGDE